MRIEPEVHKDRRDHDASSPILAEWSTLSRESVKFVKHRIEFTALLGVKHLDDALVAFS